MTLKPAAILQKLTEKQADFRQFDQAAREALQQYQSSLDQISALDAALVAAQLRSAMLENPGAEPLEPWNPNQRWVIPFGPRWTSREESKAWVQEHLTGVSTFAVDGSQIFPSKDLSIPLALVQIGWYEHDHSPNGKYEKDIALDVLTPVDLEVGDAGAMRDRQVNMRRFQMEIDRLVQYMTDRAGSESCLVFFDGSLVATFAEAFEPDMKQFYVDCVVKLLRTSQSCQIPLVAYIDTSYARDLTVMIQGLCRLSDERMIHDATLVQWTGHKPSSMTWGDRTPLFLCQRSGIREAYQDQRQQIAFTYLKAHDGPPVRLELPVWIYEAGRLETVLNWVRSEVIIGSGYPYAIETADQVAVLQTQDRQLFYKIFQDWAEQRKLKLRFSRKMVSKVLRR